MFTIDDLRDQLDESIIVNDYSIDHIHSWTFDDPNPVFGANVALYSITSDDIDENNNVEIMLRGNEILSISVRYNDAHIVSSCDEFNAAVDQRCGEMTFHPTTGKEIPQYHWSFYVAADTQVSAAEEVLSGKKNRYMSSDDETEETYPDTNGFEHEYVVEALIKVRVESINESIDGQLTEEAIDAIADALKGSLETITIKSITAVEE